MLISGSLVCRADTNTGQGSIPALLLTARAAAKAMMICERSLWDLSRKGEIPVVRIGRSVRYDPRDLTRWIEQQKVIGA